MNDLMIIGGGPDAPAAATRAIGKHLDFTFVMDHSGRWATKPQTLTGQSDDECATGEEAAKPLQQRVRASRHVAVRSFAQKVNLPTRVNLAGLVALVQTLGTGARVEPETGSVMRPTTMQTRILVAYATTFGSTAEIAEAIGAALRDDHTDVDVRGVLDVADLGPYDAVIVGSAIYNGEWLPEAVRFVRQHQAALRKVPVAYFAVCMLLHRPTPQHRRTVEIYINTVRRSAPDIKPVDVGMFAGKLRYRNLSLLERVEFFLMSWLPSGDFRDWNAVRAWALQVRPALVNKDLS